MTMSLIGEKLPPYVWLGEQNLHWDAPDDLMSQWMAFAPQAAADDDTIDIFDVIGEDWFGEGVTDKTIARALKGKSGREIRVRVNSPGGDVFAGLSIYNLLRTHNAKVTVEVTGLAASAASVIAMAADEIVMGQGAMLMIHNSWGMSVGNKHDMRETADILSKIDDQMVGIYASRSGMKETEVVALMDAETFLTAEEAVDAKLADQIDAAIAVKSQGKPDTNPLKDRRRMERALGRLGVPRNQRPEIISLIVDGAPRDASTTPAARDAGDPNEWMSEAQKLIETLKA
jgi:ATP-dependent Clp protease protease subunit